MVLQKSRVILDIVGFWNGDIRFCRCFFSMKQKSIIAACLRHAGLRGGRHFPPHCRVGLLRVSLSETARKTYFTE